MRILLLAAASSTAMVVLASAGSCTGSPNSAGAGGMSSSGSAADADAITALVDKYCEEVGSAFCDADWTCCMRAGSHVGENVNDCRQAFGFPILPFCNPTAYPDRADLESSLRAGTTVFDEQQLEKCLAQLKSLTAGGAACIEPPGSIVQRSCLSAFQGKILPGEPCTWPDKDFADSVAQCKDGRCENGKCVAFLKLGDACSPEKIWPDPAGMVCNYMQYQWCKHPPADGGAGDAGDLGVCAPMGELGDSCYPSPNDTAQCRGWVCDMTSTCVLPDPYTTECDHHY